MSIGRRQWMIAALGAPLAAARKPFPMAVMASNLRQKSELEAIPVIGRLGFDAVQVSIGRAGADSELPLAIPENQRKLTEALRGSGVALSATYLDILHGNCLKNDKLAQRWVSDGITLTRRLGCDTLMIVFFGRCSLENRTEQDYTAGVLKELLPQAERAGVVIGFENAIPAGDNRRIHDQLASRAFKIWYDVGNATCLIREDAPKSIRMLGRERICQFHMKDKGYLGEGEVNMPAVFAAIREIGYTGPLTIEGSCPGPDAPAGMARNLAYLRRLESGRS
ncbi:MAG: sugar phosphate isomerase/epimerase [Acidobacteria bacterium]|nr:sugar phosphate isomerase/epimerase [Acidobacteriota bacterium]